MCGRFFLSSPGVEIARHFGLAEVPELAPRFNLAPGQLVPVARARRSAPGVRVLELRRWGLVPHWTRDPARGPRPVNARVETAARHPAFRDAMARRRALVPADGFYEWQHRGRSAQPFAVRVSGGALFGMAALHERWRPRGETEASGAASAPLDTVTILTTEANERLRPVHDRMPAIVAPADYARWLDPALDDAAAAAALLAPTPSEWIELERVGRGVDDPRAEGPELLAPERDLFSV
jgi:putative SOS response-associated peptidase YedK